MTALNLVGKTLGQYELRETIASGNIISLYRAHQPILKRDVALNILQPHLRKDPRYSRALLRGAEIIASLAHPHIVPIHDCGTHEDITFIVMPFMLGGSLLHRLKQAPLSLQEANTITRQIAGALEYVHAQGMAHGDPSVRNIVFDAWGNAYISDFILAGFLAELQDGVAGTLHYMAPERWDEQPPTAASDQYALAAIAYEMLTGQPPFDDPDSIAALYHKHQSDPLPPLQSQRPEIPLAVNAVLERGLAKQRQDRYPTVMDFARAFEKSLAAAPQHLFVSYSRRDKHYAEALKAHLISSGFEVWLDDAIEHGDQWFNQIHDAIKACAAFVVIMTPDSEQSEWVQKEILLAKRYKKPIFPLLLAGDEFAILIDVQYGDARDGTLPGVDFQRRVRRAVFGEG